MKIFIYSDLHISKTSSILPMTSDNKYTYRQNMILETGRYLAKIVESTKPDLIINLGDTFDMHIISSYDVKVASEFFKSFNATSEIPHLVLVGNHEMINTSFNAVELLDNIPNIQVINEPITLKFGKEDNCEELAFLPYCNYKDIIEFPEGRFLFSHQDIQGSVIRGNFALPEGIDRKVLLDKYRFVFNGHIHKPSIKDNIITVGSVTTHSFSDDENSIPQCYIFDTKTLDLQVIPIKGVRPLFRKISIESIDDLDNIFVEFRNTGFKYVIQCSCPFDLRDIVKEKLDNCDFIVAHRISIKLDESIKEDTNAGISSDFGVKAIQDITQLDLNTMFKDFLEKNVLDLKYPVAMYHSVLNMEVIDADKV
jgi:hypothetical protein